MIAIVQGNSGTLTSINKKIKKNIRNNFLICNFSGRDVELVMVTVVLHLSRQSSGLSWSIFIAKPTIRRSKCRGIKGWSCVQVGNGST